MNDLGRLTAEAVDAEDTQRLAVEQYFQHASGAAGDLCARQMAKKRVAHFVRHFTRGEFAFGGAQRADFRQGVDTGGNVFHQFLFAHAGERMRGGEAALVVRRTRETGIADHVAHGVNMRLRGLIGRVHHDRAALVAWHPDGFEPHRVGVAGAPLRPQQHVTLDDFVGFEMHAHAAVIGFHAVVFFAVADQHAAFAQVVGQRVDDFVVEKRQQLVTGVDQVDLDAQATKDRGILAADHPGAVDGDAARCLL